MLSKGELPVIPDTEETGKEFKNIRFPSVVMLVARPLLHSPG